MKKILIATAIALAASASFAADGVTVYGKLRVYEESYKLGTAKAVSQVTDSDSRIGFKASEDLGNGLKATAVMETSVVADSPNTGAATQLGNRQTLVGLSASVGSVELGRAKHAIGRALDSYDVFGNAAFSSTTVVNASQGQRVSNAAFVTANVAKGVSVSFQRGESEVLGAPATLASSLDIAIAGVNATIARYNNDAGNSSTLVAGKYTLAQTGSTVSVIHSDNHVGAVHTVGNTVGLSQAIGKTPFTALASYGKNSQVKATDLGVDYALSKRTILLARYIKETNVVSAKNLQRVAVGMDMNF